MSKWTLIVVAVAIVAAACGSDSAGSMGEAEMARTPLECELEAYPCSLAEVPVEILERSDSLSDDVLAMFGVGVTRGEVVGWLNEQEGMVEVESDDEAVRFRLEGGRGTWVLRAGAFGTRSAPGTAGPVALPTVRRSSPFHVVGEPDAEKKALVLSPMLWDFGSTDDGPAVAAMLQATRGYENGVTIEVNPTANSTTVNIDDFKDWDRHGYDVVHVVSHGTRICERAPCRAAIAASTLVGDSPEEPGVEIVDVIRGLRQRGLKIAKGEGRPRGFDLAIPLVFLTADFFRAEYGGGLKDTVVFFSACETFGDQATDLGDAIRGDTSVFFGWSEVVDSGAARAAAVLLYEELAEGGYPAHEAWERVGALRIDPRLGGQLMIGKRTDGDDLRIRDVVELLDPSSGEPLSRASSVLIIGSRGDGEPDSVPYSVRVDGMLPEFAPEVILHVSVDGKEIAPQPITAGQVNDKDQWTVTGAAPLGFDLEENTTINFRAWVELYSGGESDDETPAAVVGGPIMGLEWRMTATSVVQLDTGGALESVAELILEFEEGQPFDEPHPRYVVTGGTVTYLDRDVTALGCSYVGGRQTYEVTPRMSPPLPQGSAAPSVLIFDTTIDPVGYYGVIYTSGGPDRIVTQICRYDPPGGSETNDVNYGSTVTWMTASQSSDKRVSDRKLIKGISDPAVGHKIEYTITRIR